MIGKVSVCKNTIKKIWGGESCNRKLLKYFSFSILLLTFIRLYLVVQTMPLSTVNKIVIIIFMILIIIILVHTNTLRVKRINFILQIRLQLATLGLKLLLISSSLS